MVSLHKHPLCQGMLVLPHSIGSSHLVHMLVQEGALCKVLPSGLQLAQQGKSFHFWRSVRAENQAEQGLTDCMIVSLNACRAWKINLFTTYGRGSLCPQI